MDSQAGDSLTLPPDQQVAQRIVAQLLAHGLIAPAQADTLGRGLAAGTLKAADWRLIAQQALEEEARSGQTD